MESECEMFKLLKTINVSAVRKQNPETMSFSSLAGQEKQVIKKILLL